MNKANNNTLMTQPYLCPVIQTVGMATSQTVILKMNALLKVNLRKLY